MGREVAVDVDVPDGGGIENDAPPVSIAVTIERMTVLFKRLFVKEIEQPVIQVVALDVVGELGKLDSWHHRQERPVGRGIHAAGIVVLRRTARPITRLRQSFLRNDSKSSFSNTIASLRSPRAMQW
jgi:hypothetical protein